MSTTLQIRVDKGIKEKAQKTFRGLGLDLSSGIKLYLQQVVSRGGVPFDILDTRTPNGFTIRQEIEMLKEVKAALKHGKSYRTAEELHRSILGE